VRTIDPVKHEERRKRILEVAERCFARDGFRGASISDVCKEAKISPGHLYHYFPSKEAIVRAITEKSLEYATERLARIIHKPDPIAAFVAALEGAELEQFHNRQLLALDMLAEAGRNPIIADVLQERSHALRSLLASFLRTAQESGQVDQSLDPDLAAAVLQSIFDSMATMKIRDPAISRTESLDYVKLLIVRFLAPCR
jgi:TetR/AcrR family transcriptional repressor of uid operon